LFVNKKEWKIFTNDIFTNVYVKDLDPSINSNTLKSIFKNFGEITSCVVMYDKEGKSREFGFINFSKPEEARKAVNEMNGKKNWGKRKIFICL